MLGESGSLPTNFRAMTTSLDSHCTCLHLNRATLQGTRQECTGKTRKPAQGPLRPRMNVARKNDSAGMPGHAAASQPNLIHLVPSRHL